MSEISCRITSLKAVSDTLILRMRPQLEFNFVAGQYLLLSFDGEHFKPFSIASTPTDEDIELHIRDNPNDPLENRLLEIYRAKESLKLKDPSGECTLNRVAMDRPILYIAGGTGYAPCHAMIRTLFTIENRPTVSVYWGAAQAKELYLHGDLQLWASQQTGFNYVPVVQFPSNDDVTTYRTGFVHQAVLDDGLALADYDIYLSGSGIMVGHVHTALVKAGASPEHIFSDMIDLGMAQFPE